MEKDKKYFVKDFETGKTDPYKKMILYAVVVDENDELQCSATVDFILEMYYERRDQVVNYRETLIKYIRHNEKLRKELYDEIYNH